MPKTNQKFVIKNKNAKSIKPNTHHYKKPNFKRWNAENQKLYKSLNYIMVVKGYHYGWIKDNQNKHIAHPYISDKPYSFRVVLNTHNIKYAFENQAKTATVMTARGVQKLYITKIGQITKKFGSAVRKEAKALKPVLAFSKRTPKKNWFHNAIKRVENGGKIGRAVNK